jgi:DNA helicase MCM8
LVLRLQELILDQRDVESGRIPRTIECELTEDLTNSVVPGDLITLNGIVKALTNETQGGGRSGRDKCTFILYIYANSIQGMGTSDSGEKTNRQSSNIKDIEFTPLDIECFNEIKSEPNVFK